MISTIGIWIFVVGGFAIILWANWPALSARGDRETKKKLEVLQDARAHCQKMLNEFPKSMSTSGYDQRGGSVFTNAGNALQRLRELDLLNDLPGLINILNGVDKGEHEWQARFDCGISCHRFFGFWFWAKNQFDTRPEPLGHFYEYALERFIEIVDDKIVRNDPNKSPRLKHYAARLNRRREAILDSKNRTSYAAKSKDGLVQQQNVINDLRSADAEALLPKWMSKCLDKTDDITGSWVSIIKELHARKKVTHPDFLADGKTSDGRWVVPNGQLDIFIQHSADVVDAIIATCFDST